MKRLLPLLITLCAVVTLLIVATASAAVNVKLKYTVTQSWQGGFEARVKIKNKAAAPITAWQLEFDFPYNLTSIWDASVVSHNGAHYVIRGANWNKTIAANGAVSFGFVAASDNASGKPSNCTLNGAAVKCKGQTSAASATPTRTPRKTNTPTLTPKFSATPTKTLTPTRTPTVGPSPTPGSSPNLPARVFAPYVDTLLWPTPNLAQIFQQSGVKYFTLAFIISRNGCNASWGGVIPLSDDFFKPELTALRQAGGNAIISFGGANGVELAQNCSTVSALQAQYQAVIDRYGFAYLDFDIEGAAIEDSASVSRRNQAIAALQANAQAHGKTLNVSYTLPVLPTGLTWQGVDLLEDAVAKGVQISAVNIMAMDYGGASVADPYKMGDNAIAAANSLHTQLKTLYPNKTDAQLWRMVGVTPMIGLNDVAPEVFTLADAQKLLTFAQQNNISRLAMWSISRDQSCPNNGAYVASDCSGITQSKWAFSNIWKAFTQ